MLVIDGHNLIPKVPGLSLRAMDDEEQLLRLLQLYARVRRKRIEVFFDKAPVGQSGERVYGTVRAHFVREGKTADEAIVQFLVRLKKGARNVSVVSSDRRVQADAAARGAQVIPSEDFGRELLDMRAGLDFNAAKARGARGKAPDAPTGEAPDAGQHAGNLKEWYDLFGFDARQAEKPIDLSPNKPSGKPKKPGRPNQRPGSGSRPHHGFPKKKDF